VAVLVERRKSVSKKPSDNKFHRGNGVDGKHYWLTPPELLRNLNSEFKFDFDPCPFPLPEGFDGLSCEWGESNYVNPPFGSILHKGPNDSKPKKKGPTAWVRKCISEKLKGKKSVMVFPVDKWVLMMIEHCSEIRNLGDVKWLATEDQSQGKGLGRHIAMFILDPKQKNRSELQAENLGLQRKLDLAVEALEFYEPDFKYRDSYFDPEIKIFDDNGKCARQVLAQIRGEE
jgi:hypothetical protein